MHADEIREVFEALDAEPSSEFSETLLARLRSEYGRSGLHAGRAIDDPGFEPEMVDPLYLEPRVSGGDGVGHWSRRRRRLVGLVAAATVIVAATLVVRTALDDGPEVVAGPSSGAVSTTVPPPRAGAPEAPPRFIPLPPEGATPSAPVNGVLLLSLQACGGPSSLPWSGNLAVYADGRLLWHTYEDPFEGDPSGGSGPRPTSGWREQRLTPEGVALLRSELVSSGLFSPGQSGDASGRLSSPQSGDWCPNDSYLAGARIGDRDEYYVGALPDELVERITDPASWLPPSAWEDREVRPFVPASYTICVSGLEPRISVSEIATALPARLGDLVRARSWEENHAGPVLWFWCTGAATEDARTFTEALDTAGLERSVQPMMLPGPDYLFDYQDTSRRERLHISFWPGTPGTPPSGCWCAAAITATG